MKASSVPEINTASPDPKPAFARPGDERTAVAAGWFIDHQYLVRFSLLATGLLVVTVLAGWFAGNNLLVRMLPGGPAMVLDTALCFGLFAIGFWSIQDKASDAASLAGLLLIFVAGAHLVFLKSAVSLHWLIPRLTAAILSPAEQLDPRMAPATSVVLLLLGATLVCCGNRRLRARVAWFVLAAGFVAGSIGLFALLRLVDRIDDGGFFERLSAPAAIASCAVGFALCAYALGHSGLRRAEWPLATAVLGSIALVLLFAGIKRSEFVSTASVNRIREDLTVTYRRLNSLQILVDSVRKAESSERGFLLTRSEFYLRSYRTAIAEIAARPGDDAASPLLRDLISRRLAELSRIMQLAQSGNPAQASEIVREGRGLASMEQLDAEARRLIGKLEQERELRADQSGKLIARMNRMLVSSFFVAALLVALASFLVVHETRRRGRLEDALLRNESVLETRVVARTREVVKKAAEARRSALRREQVEKQLREMQQRLATGLTSSEVAVWDWNIQEGGFLAWSGPLQQIFGVGPSRLNSYPALRRLMIGEDRDSVDRKLEVSMETGVPFAAEFRIAKPGGGIRWIAVRGGAVLDLGGRVGRMAGVSYDITSGKLAEQRLVESEKRFRELANAMPQIVWTATADGAFDFHNDRWLQLTGSAHGESDGLRDRMALLHPDDYHRWLQLWTSARHSGSPYEGEFRLWDRSRGEFRWHLSRAVPVKDDSGALARWFGTATDIHEQKRAEELAVDLTHKLLERERQLALIFDHGGIGNFIWPDAQGNVSAHATVWKLYGAPEQQGSVPASWFRERQHPDDREMVDREVRIMLQTGRPLDIEFRVVWPDGSVRWLACWAAVRSNAEGSPVEVCGVNADISARKEAEAGLREREHRFRTLCNAIPQIVWMTGPDGRFDFYNDRWYEFIGSASLQGTGDGWKPFLHPDDAEYWQDGWRASVQSGQKYETELRFWDQARQEYRWYLTRALPLLADDGKVARWFGALSDIHERKTAQQHLESEVQRQTEELRRSLLEKETLLKEVHHRVKNNLQIISSLLRMQSDTLLDPGAAAALRDSQRRVLSMALIHERLYGSRQMDAIDFCEYIRILVNDLYYSYAQRSSLVSCRVAASPVILNIDQAIPCGLILNELVTNALKYAYPPGSAGEVVVELCQTPEGRVKLRVSDTGAGLPEGFSWKNAKSLGLSIVEVLTGQLGGTLSVEPGQGASFLVEFPKDASRIASPPLPRADRFPTRRFLRAHVS